MITFYTWSQPKGISHYNSRILGCSQRFGFSVWRLITFIVNLTDLESVCHQQGRSTFSSRLWLTEHSSGLAAAGRGLETQVTWFLVGPPQHDCAHSTSVSSSLNWGSAHRVPPKHREFVWACSKGRQVQQLAPRLTHKDTLNRPSVAVIPGCAGRVPNPSHGTLGSGNFLS